MKKNNLNMNIVLYYASIAVLFLLFCLNAILFMEDSRAINMNLTIGARVVSLNIPMFIFFIGSEALVICALYLCKRWLGKDIDKLKNRKKK